MARRCSVVAVAIWFLLATPPLRRWLESSMSTHMLVQIPLLAATGFVAARALSPKRRAVLRRVLGGPLPFVLVAVFVSTHWMLPRSLDGALLEPRVAVAKFLTLPLLVGAPLAIGWERLGPIARGFVWTNYFSMLAVLGWLYLAAPVRVCNNYLASEQHDTGTRLVWLAAALFLWWLGRMFVGPGAPPTRANGPRLEVPRAVQRVPRGTRPT